MNIKSIAALFTAGAIALAPTAQANDFSFSYSQTEMDSEKGRKTVLKRLEKEARRHCRSELGTAGVSAGQHRACQAEAVEVIVAEIDDVRFAALYKDSVVIASR